MAAKKKAVEKKQPAKRVTKPPHKPTKAMRQTVQMHTIVGTTQEMLAQVLGIDEKTLRKHYRHELDLSKAKANASVGGALYKKAIGGDVRAQEFWMATQAGWRKSSEVEVIGDFSPISAIEVTVVGQKAKD